MRNTINMKLFSLLISSSLLLAACNSNEANTGVATETTSATATAPAAANDSTNITSIQWLDSTHQDLGKINEGQVVEISWRFKNTGTKPLIVTNVSASCGCTVPDKPEQPIAPGAEETIRARFDSKDRVGPQRKDVYVEANTAGSRSSQLSFALEVVKK
jgi:hypothetical protein